MSVCLCVCVSVRLCVCVSVYVYARPSRIGEINKRNDTRVTVSLARECSMDIISMHTITAHHTTPHWSHHQRTNERTHTITNSLCAAVSEVRLALDLCMYVQYECTKCSVLPVRTHTNVHTCVSDKERRKMRHRTLTFLHPASRPRASHADFVTD